jgi:hypothetical protein
MSIPKKIGSTIFFALLGMSSALAQSSWTSVQVHQEQTFSCCYTQIPIGPAATTDVVQLLRLGGAISGPLISIPLGAFASALDIQAANGRIDQAFQQLQQFQQQQQQQLQQFQRSITQVERGVAAASAMANVFMPSAPGRTAWAVNASAFQGEFGAGFSFAHRLSTSVPVAITASYGNGGGNAHVGRVGLMGEF